MIIEFDINEIHGKIKYVEDYLYGEKTGKVKEYINNKLIYEGEYLNRERSGVGNEYDFNGNILFEDENLNGKKWVGIRKE